MALLDIRLRAGYLFLAVAIGHIVLISAQVNSRTGVPILETVTFGAFAEVQRGTSALLNGVRGAWSGYVALRNVRAENEALRQELASAQIEIQRQRALADRSRSLESILQLGSSTELQTTAAQIIGAAAGPDFRTVTIDIGFDVGSNAVVRARSRTAQRAADGTSGTHGNREGQRQRVDRFVRVCHQDQVVVGIYAGVVHISARPSGRRYRRLSG